MRRPLPHAKVPQHFRDYECPFKIPLGIFFSHNSIGCDICDHHCWRVRIARHDLWHYRRVCDQYIFQSYDTKIRVHDCHRIRGVAHTACAYGVIGGAQTFVDVLQ